MIVVDASVLIAHLDEGDAHHARAVRHLLDVADRQLGCSPLTLADVLVGPARHGRIDAARDALVALEVTRIPLPEDAPERLAALRAETSLELPDCCVIVAAQAAGADAVLTFDDRLDEVARQRGFR